MFTSYCRVESDQMMVERSAIIYPHAVVLLITLIYRKIFIRF